MEPRTARKRLGASITTTAIGKQDGASITVAAEIFGHTSGIIHHEGPEGHEGRNWLGVASLGEADRLVYLQAFSLVVQTVGSSCVVVVLRKVFSGFRVEEAAHRIELAEVESENFMKCFLGFGGL